MALPVPASNQAYCNVSVLEAGHIDVPLAWAIDTVTGDERINVPALSFLLRHSVSGTTILFDLGIRSDHTHLPPALVKRIQSMFVVDIPQDVVASLAKGGLQPDDINYVCYSHLHWDHIGDSAPFTRSTFLVGAGAEPFVQNGYPDTPDALFAADLLPSDRTRWLAPEAWPPVGPFPHALDFFGDGSLYLVDAGPGHMPGHINALARTSHDGGWVYLAGDSAHDRRLLMGEAGIPHHAKWGCAHRDPEASLAHIARIRELMEGNSRVRVVLAHDKPWYEENKGGSAYWPGQMESL